MEMKVTFVWELCQAIVNADAVFIEVTDYSVTSQPNMTFVKFWLHHNK